MARQPSRTRTKNLPFSRRVLHGPELPAYAGESLKMVSFPLGGIGTGTIGLGGRGELRDWEIYNAPNFGYRPPYTMPYIFCRQGRRKVAKVLERRLLPPYHASHGLPPDRLAGMPRLEEAAFLGTYPVARIFFQDDELPVTVELEAFNPMIPGDAEASGIPATVLIYRVANPTRSRCSGTVAISMANTVGLSCKDGVGANVNAWRETKACRGLHMTTGKYPCEHIGFGSLALATTARRCSYCVDFEESGWWDRAQKMWDSFRAEGKPPRTKRRSAVGGDGYMPVGMLAAEYDLAPRKSAEIVFIIAWSFPNRPAGWCVTETDKSHVVRNHYARKFPDAWKVARHVAANFDHLRGATFAFERALFDSTLPGVVLDAVSSQMSTIRTNTTMWLDEPADEKGGRIYAFEGCSPTSGCCPMNCTHVWNYEQSMAHLYPSLERTMRETDYDLNVRSEGSMLYRTPVPLSGVAPRWLRRSPAADGQFGTIVKLHREWRISGDTKWLKSLWPMVRQSIRFAWKGAAGWDADKDGVMEGIQHNTYDIQFHGPNTMCGSLYLAGLLAGMEMAEAVGDSAAAAEFRQVYESGRKKYDRALFNGEFYEQKVADVGKVPSALLGTGRPKYQYGAGCLSDQLLGQWAAHVAGLGYVLPAEHVKKAIEAVFRHNFKHDLTGHESVQRTYALNDEAGLVLCTWPRGKRERYPFPYSDEVWTGVEYQVAAHLIYEGFVNEGLAVVAAARERHDGLRRNPWNEFECGDHYARAMANWSVLLALAGQRYDGLTERLTMQPVVHPKDFCCIYTAADGFGTFRQQFGFAHRKKLAGEKLTVTVDCIHGKVRLRSIGLDWPGAGSPRKLSARVRVDGEPARASIRREDEGLLVKLDRRVVLCPGAKLQVSLS